MKIAVSSTSTIPSTTANSIQVLMACQGLVQNGQEICLWVPGKESPDFDLLRKQYGLTCQSFPVLPIRSRKRLHRLDFSRQTEKESRKWGADCIYTWTIQVALIASRHRLPVIFEVHDLPKGTFGKRWFNEFAKSDTVKRFAFITRALEEEVCAEYLNLRKSDCLIAPNGINPEEYQDLPNSHEAKKEMGFEDRIIASCSGHLYPGRGVELFLRLASEFPEIDFYWFGGTADSVKYYREKAAESGLKNVIFTGFIPKSEIPLAQAASDFLLMPYEKTIAGSSGGNSAAICSPMKMFEYLAAGKPILASNLPVIHEILDPTCAVFCEPENLSSWIEGLKMLLDHPEEAAKLAAAAKRKSSFYSWKNREKMILDALTEGKNANKS